MHEAERLLEDCIVKLEHIADNPFLDPEANAAWCQAIATVLRDVLENLHYD